ncbi:MAG: helix-turn-helix transcriptional regulator [Treponema sp.]|jgi:LuxR family maltose regulon positive regulatory protein|nr:helix-turn-helix transcriptional regulator [Treponema sp.]
MAAGNQIYLERSRIELLMEKAMQSPVLSVVAGTGYGKTYAVYSFLKDYKARIIWTQLSEWDNNGERFWENFISSVSVLDAEILAKTLPLGFPSTDQQFRHCADIVQSFLNPSGKYIFVFDDLHLITEKAVLRFLERLITIPYPHIVNIFISRTEPALNLATIESKGFLTRITEEDLRFTQEEMISYFRLYDINISPQTAAAVYHDTEGWAFAIHLAGLSFKNAPTGASYVPQALKFNIFKLIESEIMSPLPEDQQRFLIKLSLIERLAPDLINEIAGDPSLITGIAKTGSFIRFDSFLNAYRIHHLFLDYLKGRQKVLSEEEKRNVWEKAADWNAANNQKMDAISYYEKARLYRNMMDFIYTFPLFPPNNFARMLLEIFDRAPREIFEENPQAPTIYTRLYITLELFDRAAEELKKIFAGLDHDSPNPAVHRTLAGCYNNLGYVGMFLSTYNQDYSFVANFEKGREHSKRSGYQPKPPLSVFPISSYICRGNNPAKGGLEKYIAALEKTVPCLTASMNGSSWGLDDLAWGELALFKGDMETAESKLNAALRKARERDQYEIENRSLFYLIRLNITRGNAAEIRLLIKQLEAQLDEIHFPNRFTYYDIVAGWFYSHIGRNDKMAPWIKSDFEESDLNSIIHGLELLVKAKYQLSKKRYQRALTILENRNKKYGVWAFVMGKIEMLSLEAVCRFQMNDREGAYRVMTSAFEQAAPNELFFPFTELGSAMQDLTAAALNDGQCGSVPGEKLEEFNRNAANYAKQGIQKLEGNSENFDF